MTKFYRKKLDVKINNKSCVRDFPPLSLMRIWGLMSLLFLKLEKFKICWGSESQNHMHVFYRNPQSETMSEKGFLQHKLEATNDNH